MPRTVIVVGASAGGLDAVTNVIKRLPLKFNAPIFVVIHTSPEGPGLLSTILNRAGPLPAKTAQQGELIRSGLIYVAPPDLHLVVTRNRIRLTSGPREHRFRPAIDPLFRSAAEHYGAGVIGIVLSGNMGDGTHGLITIKRAGGIAIVQDPKEALAPMMPLSALRRVDVDYVLPAEHVAGVVTGLVMKTHPNGPRRQGARKRRAPAVPPPTPERPGRDALETGVLHGPPSPFTCPDCGGALWEFKDSELVRYRCHVGHGFTAESLGNGQREMVEDALWSALRALEESIELRKRMANRAKSRNLTAILPGIVREMESLQQRTDALRSLLLATPPDESPMKRKRGRRKSNGQTKR